MNALGVVSMVYARPFDREHFPCFARMREAGMDFVELLVPEPGELDPVETRAALAGAGLGAVLAARVNAARDLAGDDEAARAAGLAYLRGCVDAAEALGAKIVGGPLYGAPLVFAGRAPRPWSDAERERRVDRVVAGLRQAAGYAAEKGVVLAVEPLNRFETDMVNTTDQGIELARRVDRPALALALDTFHMNMEDDSVAGAIVRAAGRIAHFQANENHRGFVGTGHIEWQAVAAALAAVAYDGPISLEPFRRDDERLGVPRAQWRAPSEDQTPKLAASARRLRRFLAEARGGA